MGKVNRYIAFLRAINVGGNHAVKMDRLRELFESLEFKNVETLIASGNVIFDARSDDAAALERKIEKHLEDALGYEVVTFVRSTSEVRAVSEYQPFRDAEKCALTVAFLKSSPDADAKKRIAALGSSNDEFHLHDREVYWLCRTRMSESVFFGAKLEKTFGMPTTMRNVTTVRKLAAKYQ